MVRATQASGNPPDVRGRPRQASRGSAAGVSWELPECFEIGVASDRFVVRHPDEGAALGQRDEEAVERVFI